MPVILQFDESLDVGSDTLTAVDDKINKITRTIDRPKLTPGDEK